MQGGACTVQSKDWQIQTVTECSQGLCSRPKLNTSEPASIPSLVDTGLSTQHAMLEQSSSRGLTHSWLLRTLWTGLFLPPFHSSWGNRGE